MANFRNPNRLINQTRHPDGYFKFFYVKMEGDRRRRLKTDAKNKHSFTEALNCYMAVNYTDKKFTIINHPFQ